MLSASVRQERNAMGYYIMYTIIDSFWYNALGYTGIYLLNVVNIHKV